MPRDYTPLLVLVCVLCSPPMPGSMRLECVADTNLSSYESEQEFNYGASPRIRLKGIQMLGLFRFDMTPLSGKAVRSAALHLRYAGADRSLRTLGVSALTEPWVEGDGRGERRPGQACFRDVSLGLRAWAADATDFAEVIFRKPEVCAYTDIKHGSAGWVSVEVPPAAVQAMAAGLATGLVVTDEKGQTAANNDVHSREQSGSEPYLTVHAEPCTAVHPSPVSGLRARPEPASADLRSGALRIWFIVPPDAIGVVAEVHTASAASPVAAPLRTLSIESPGARSAVLRDLPPGREATVRMQAVGPTGLRSRCMECRAVTSPSLARPAALLSSRERARLTRSPLFSTGAAIVSVGPPGCREEPDHGAERGRSGFQCWDGSAVVLSVARGETASFALVLRSHAGASVRVVPRLWVPARLSRVEMIRDGVWLPEACLPFDGALEVPSSQSAAPGNHQALVLVEIAIPTTVRGRLVKGVVRVVETGGGAATIPVHVRVMPFALPNAPGFDVSLNTYGSPARASGAAPESREGLALEHAYHRLAYEHRCTLTPLGYSHSGNMEPGYAPSTDGAGAMRRVTDWTAWDSRFGPLLDGTAFASGGRARQPISHVYLPFHEVWPEDIRTEYAYAPSTRAYPQIIAEHALQAGTIDELLSAAYTAGVKAVAREFDRHFRERAWGRTRFHFYLNNKHNYRDPAAGGRGTSWWLLDEPMHRDDWLALAWFARSMRDAVGGASDRRIWFRADVSRPQWQRDHLRGLVDLMVVNDELYARTELMRAFRQDGGIRLWHYGAAPAIRAPLSGCEAWPVRAYLAGADGIVPWQSVGRRENHRTPEATALILPHPMEPAGVPVATLRLKALSRGQVTVEYMRALAASRGWSREQVAEAVAPFYRAGDFAGMRLAILQALDRSLPSPSHAEQSSGQRPAGLSRRPRPKP